MYHITLAYKVIKSSFIKIYLERLLSDLFLTFLICLSYFWYNKSSKIEENLTDMKDKDKLGMIWIVGKTETDEQIDKKWHRRRLDRLTKDHTLTLFYTHTHIHAHTGTHTLSLSLPLRFRSLFLLKSAPGHLNERKKSGFLRTKRKLGG